MPGLRLLASALLWLAQTASLAGQVVTTTVTAGTFHSPSVGMSVSGSTGGLTSAKFDGNTLFESKPNGLDFQYFSTIGINPHPINPEIVQRGNVRMFSADSSVRAGWFSNADVLFSVDHDDLPNGSTVGVSLILGINVIVGQARDGSTPVGGAYIESMYSLTDLSGGAVMDPFFGFVDYIASPEPVLGSDYLTLFNQLLLGDSNAWRVSGAVIRGTTLQTGQTYRLSSSHYGEVEIFADGFETGDTSAWSSSVPSSHLVLDGIGDGVKFNIIVVPELSTVSLAVLALWLWASGSPFGWRWQ
jgi:hypothetical protein